MLDPSTPEEEEEKVKARLDLCDLKSGLTVVSSAGPASCLHLGQEALHRILEGDVFKDVQKGRTWGYFQWVKCRATIFTINGC